MMTNLSKFTQLGYGTFRYLLTFIYVNEVCFRLSKCKYVWHHGHIFGWLIGEEGRVTTAHKVKRNFEVVYPFSISEPKKRKSFLLISFQIEKQSKRTKTVNLLIRF